MEVFEISKTKYILVAVLIVVGLSACLPSTIEQVGSESEVSSTFSIPVTFGDGKNGEYILIGEKEKLAFQIGSGSDNEIETLPIVANQPNKYMWYLWGENLSGKPFKVIGTNTNMDIKQEIVILDNIVLGSGLNGADASTPSSMEFPTAGIWNLNAYVDDELFGNITIKVK